MEALEKSLLDMQSGVEKASNIMNELNTKFASSDAKHIGNNSSI